MRSVSPNSELLPHQHPRIDGHPEAVGEELTLTEEGIVNIQPTALEGLEVALSLGEDEVGPQDGGAGLGGDAGEL